LAMLVAERRGHPHDRGSVSVGRVHESLRVKNADGTYTQRTPAMAAGVAKYKWSLEQTAALLD
jgi:hypothetical protein